MIEYATIGEITLDDTVLDTGETRLSQTGGGSVYSALGIRLWGHSVGISSVIGKHYPQEHLDELNRHGIVTRGVHRSDGWGLRLWLLHEEENRKQQVPKLRSSTFDEMDCERPDLPQDYLQARGYHLAPATSEGQMRGRDSLRRARPDAVLSLDILTEPFIRLASYRDGSAFDGVDIFSPSIAEIEALWPGDSLGIVLHRLAGFGVRWIAIKMDTRGSVVHDAVKGETYRLPIYPARTVDATGAGDAFSGGFLEGIVETDDVFEAGLRGTISASFAVEHWGAFPMLRITTDEARARLNWLREQIGGRTGCRWRPAQE